MRPLQRRGEPSSSGFRLLTNIELRCSHRLVVDQLHPATFGLWRLCLTCGVSYDRSKVISALKARCESRWKIDFGLVNRILKSDDEEEDDPW